MMISLRAFRSVFVRARGARSLIVSAALAACALPGAAQDADSLAAARDSAPVFLLDALNITAVRGMRPVFTTPAPVTVLPGSALGRGVVANVSDAFLRVPGLDAEGVGPTQRRPVVRGMRGQRVLLLEDGLRLNNARRRVDSGEPTGLVWLADLDRVEVVRGPASVLYGSDAVGGVVNLVTRDTPVERSRLRGRLEAGGRTAGSATSLSGSARAGTGRVGFALSGGFRSADPYRAPAGTFGTLTLADDAEVHDSGGEERAVRLEARWQAAAGHDIFARHEAYRSEDSGFGWLDPALLGGDVTTRLTWPRQDFRRTVVGYAARGLGAGLADGVRVTLYTQGNERSFFTDVDAPLPGPPGAGLSVRSRNHTDLTSRGLRVEARTLAGAAALVTWGLDGYEDRSEGADSSTTTVRGFGPTSVTERSGPTIPDARLRNLGAFAQAQLDLGGATEVVVGARYQDVRSRALRTPGNDAVPVTYDDRTVVGSLNVVHLVGTRVALVGSVARGFRTPNLVERFFTGRTGNGRGFWEANPDLAPESSVNLEAGVRLRTDRLRGELFLFRNALADGIVLEPTGDTVGRATVFRNVNVDELRYRGAEATLDAALAGGFGLRADATLLDVDDARDPARVVAETYPHRLGLELRWSDAEGRVHAAWGVRRNGRRDTLAGATPVGEAMPAFTVHRLRAGVRLLDRHTLTIAVDNLTDALYAEALNTGFFRPEPGRTLAASLSVVF